ncbi:MAG: polyprenol monophosphomannose synthase [Chloroflexi bacterium]|nr:polyprenol monophosphomannose synthase [Chloroflexota bacterium]
MQLTVVIPTFNEAENLPALVSVLFGLPLPDLHILVVDDNSPDGTGVAAEVLAQSSGGRLAVMHRAGKLGLGTAYIAGFQRALGEGAQAVAQMDADFSHPPEMLLRLLQALPDTDVAMGSRYVPGGAVDHHWPAWRKGLSAFGNLYARAILRLPVRDATGGFRAWRRETLLGMPLERVRSNGYAFQVEMAYIACRLGYRFQEIPFYFADRKWGHSKMSLRIQREAALRVWQLLYEYRNLHDLRRAAR